MRQYAVLKNIARGTNFGVVVKSGDAYKFFGWSEKGIEWAQWANRTNAGIESLPDGVSIGEMKEMSDDLMKKVIISSEEAKAAGEALVEKKVLVFHSASEAFPNASKFPSISDTQLIFLGGRKQVAVDYKIRNFARGVAQSEIALNVRLNRLAFDNDTKQFCPRPNSDSKSYIRSNIRSKISRGAERKFGKRVNEAININIEKKQFGIYFERRNVGTNVKSIIDFRVKSRLGRAIGGAARVGVGRISRRAGMSATREISGVLDPMKRRDVDGDGMIFDGTWREMPDPTRFARMSDSPRPSRDRTTDGDIALQSRRAGRIPSERVVTGREQRLVSARQETPAPTDAAEQTRRGGKRVAVATSTRRAQATTERAANPRGISSSGDTRKPAAKGGISFASIRKVLGRRKVSQSDGSAWENMTEEQRNIVKDIINKRKESIDNTLKTKHFKKYWAGQVRGAKKQSFIAAAQRARAATREGGNRKAGRYEARSNKEPLNINDIEEMFAIVDVDIDKGALTKFKRDKEGKIIFNENGEAELDQRYVTVQRLLDDALTIIQMQDSDDYSLLEHLHPASRKVIGTGVKKQDPSVKIPKSFSTAQSTAAMHAGGEEKNKPRAAIADSETGETGGKKRFATLGSRILRMDPEREKRVQLRAQRRNRQIGRRGVLLNPAKEIKRKKLRAAAFKRSVLSKFRRDRNPETLSDDLGIRRNELHPVQIASDGAISLRPEFMQIIAALDKSFNDKSRDATNDQLLADLWENLGYSEVPTLVTEDEVKSLISAGWQPVIRGTGAQEVESEGYVEQFLTSEGRFIPGRGARAYGVGEYFAYPGGNWTGYSGNPETDRHSMLVLIPPSATIMTRGQVSAEQNSMRDLTEKAVGALKVLGGRDATSKMEPGELASEIRKSVPDIEDGKTRSSQIISRLLERLEELDRAGNTPAARKEVQDILDTFDYLGRVSKAQEEGYFAPIIGVDAIDTNDGASTANPLLLHNRSIVAAFQAPMTRNSAEGMSQGTKKVWTKWKRKPRVVDDESGTGAKRRRTAVGTRRKRPASQGDEKPQNTQAAAQKAQNVVDTTGWRSSRPQSTGSNPATMLTAPDGTEYYAKLRKPSESVQDARQRMETEVLASDLYKLAGVQAADLSIGDDSGEPQMLSRMIQARMPNSGADNDAARGGFVVDAWLANWDAPLNDNIKIDNNGNPVRLDVGGSLDYRAQGGLKGRGGTVAFGDTVGEITSMQKSGTYDFTNIDPREIRRQANQLSNITDQQIRDTVSNIVTDPQRAAKLAQTLINRRNDIVANYG